MTEEEWLTSTALKPMLRFSNASDRKLRLVACALARRIWDWLDEVHRARVEFTEQFADGLVGSDGWTRSAVLKGVGWGFMRNRNAFRVACISAEWVIGGDSEQVDMRRKQDRNERIEQIRLIRDIFGNPFRPVTADPSWLTSDVLVLAKGIYQERAFDRMPILADALMDAGCDNDSILNHCRQPGEHVRGYWVIDLLLGKE